MLEISNYKYNVFPFDLTSGLDEELGIPSGHVYIKEATDSDTYVNVQPDTKSNDILSLKEHYALIVKSKKLYLSAPAQPGKSIEVVISDSYDTFKIIEMNPEQNVNVNEDIVIRSGTPVLTNKVCTLAATEYSHVMPTNCNQFIFKARGGTMNLAVVSGQSGTTYIQLGDGQSISQENLNLVGKTLYFQCDTATAVMEILTWVA